MNFKQRVITDLQAHVALSEEQIASLIERPKNAKLGDYAFPVFALAKIEHKNPVVIARDLAEKLSDPAFSQIQAVGPYVNFLIAHDCLVSETLHEVLTQQTAYGTQHIGSGNVPIDMSSPNIAKPMSMGHLRSTMIGNAIANILTKVGYTPIKINYLGDWGTQFGKLIYAYKTWGDEEAVKRDPINTLVKYYVEFHQKAEQDPSLDAQGRAWFKKLESGDKEALYLWRWFRDASLKEFKRIYGELDVHFDSITGESDFNDKMTPIISQLEDKHLLKTSQGAKIVDLGEDQNPALIQKSDGASLYITRDLAAAIYRKQKYDFVMSLYVVGNEQGEHFTQLKAVLKLMGYDWSDQIHHIPFGLITSGGKKLSTRKGNIIMLDKVLKDAVSLAHEQIAVKNPDLENADQVAHDVGVGAVVFHDLKNERLDNFDFDLKEVVRFEGDTGPYVQYTNARAQSILRKAKKPIELTSLALTDDAAFSVAKDLAEFPEIIKKSAERFEPSVIAKFALNLAKKFNKYYAKVKILSDDDQLNARLALVSATSLVLTESLRLLGVHAPQRM